ncbi:MAG: tetratricopeptide repeat protein [Pseudomonadota bacterium]
MQSGPPEGATLHLGDDFYTWVGGRLQDADGRDVPLRAKSLAMFQALLASRGRVLSKDQLSALVWPDTVATDESIARCIADIRKALNDDAHKIVQTYPKQGYQLTLAPPRGPVGQIQHPSRVRWLAAGVAAVALAIAAFVTVDTRAAAPVALETLVQAQELRNTIAIVPFNGESDGDQFLATGLADDLAMHLAELSGLRVLSQAQTAAMATDTAAPVDLARALDTRYIVFGDLRANAGQVAFGLQLIDGRDGALLWADRYEGARSGLLEYRARLPEALAGAMSIALNENDRRRLTVRDTRSAAAFEHLLHARRDISAFTYEGSLSAERHLRHAIARDPRYARAHAELASVFVIRMENDWIVLNDADTERAFYFAERALELDPDLWFAHYAMGRLHSVTASGDIPTALTHLKKAMLLQPANDDPRIYYAIVLMMSGQLDPARTIFESVLATHPNPPFWYRLGYANALFYLRDYEAALASVTQCLNQMPNSPYCLRTQIAVLARLERFDDAAWTVDEYAILGHDISLDSVMKSAIERDPDMLAHLRASYAMAGLE